jgi:hypothetical protein
MISRLNAWNWFRMRNVQCWKNRRLLRADQSSITHEEREDDAESELEEISEDQETPSEETTKKTSRKRVVVPSWSDDSE